MTAAQDPSAAPAPEANAAVRPASRRAWRPDREWVLVILTVLAAALSALSVWQATTYAETANDLQNQERIAAGRRTEELAAFSVRVDHDLRLLVPYCAALTERGWALLDTFDDPGGSPTELADASRRVTVVGSLFQLAYPYDCQPAAGAGLMASAYDWQAAGGLGSGAADPAALIERADEASQREALLMAAGVAFAGALLLLTFADAARSHRRRAPSSTTGTPWPTFWLGVAVVLLALGAVVVLTRVDLGPGESVWVGAVLVAGAVMSLPAAVRAWGRAVRPIATAPRLQRVRWWRRRPIGWWAEIIGAAAVVVFAATALGLSVSSLLERDARAAADRLDATADRILAQGEQTAMRDLAMVAGLVGLDIAETGLPDVVASDVTDLEAIARGDLRDIGASGDADACAAWRARPAGPPDPEALLATAEVHPNAFSDHIADSLEPGLACATLAAVVRDEAGEWGVQRSLFTVALVILGLAGFLVGSAGDASRTPRTARWLLRMGIVGVSLGMIVAGVGASAFLGRGDVAARPEDDPDLHAFADAYAAGRTALTVGRCADASTAFKAAIEVHQDYASAYLDQALAMTCKEPGPVMSTGIADVDVYLALLEAAAAGGLDDHRVRTALGWGYFLEGVATKDRAKLEAALAQTVAARDEVESSARAAREPLPIIHSIRMNEAVTRLALGQDAAPQYERMVDCLAGVVACPGGAISDVALRSIFLLSALADLELLGAPVEDLDPTRTALITRFLGIQPGPRPAALVDPSVDVFPQEVQLTTAGDDSITASVIWYHRASDSEPWALVRDPSRSTLHVGGHLGTPIRADAVLPIGKYRADVYRDGHLVGRGSGDLTSQIDGSHRAVTDLGLSVVLPDTWQRSDTFSELHEEAAFGPAPDDPKLLLRRLEGALVEDTADLRSQVDAWVAGLFPDPGDLDGAVDISDPYYLGLTPVIAREYPDIGWRAVAGFDSYATGDRCPGTLFMAMYIPDADGFKTFDSIVLTAPSEPVPDLPRDFTSAAYGFSLRIPDGWDAFESPSGRGGSTSQFVARDCASGTNIRVGSEPVADRTLSQYVADNVRDLEAFEGFRLIAREPMTMPSGASAQRITYTWLAPHAVQQVQVYAIVGSTAYFATLTTALEDAVANETLFDDLVSSLDYQGVDEASGAP